MTKENRLNNQIHLYSVDTSAFYTEEEKTIGDQIMKLSISVNKVKNNSDYKEQIKTINEQIDLLDKSIQVAKDSGNKELKKSLNKKVEQLKEYRKELNKDIKSNNEEIQKLKDELKQLLADNKNKGIHRTLNAESLKNTNINSVFESTLTRTLGIEADITTKDIIIVRTYYYDVLESLITKGFTLEGEQYVFWSASAGQIRKKKTVFIKKSLYDVHKLSLMCGLTIERINNTVVGKDDKGNEIKGINPNKFLAYSALAATNTVRWTTFNIDKAIVVDDMEFEVSGIVDYIDTKNGTFEIDPKKPKNIPINHTDGAGMVLPSVSKKNFQVRLPWIKGLLTPFDFKKWILKKREETGNDRIGIINDIYNDEHDIIKDEISVIFTRSQFKMAAYYTSWEEYQDNFITYGCEAGKCNEEQDKEPVVKLGYQFLQTLTEFGNDELNDIAQNTIKHIKSIGKTNKSMLKLLSANSANKKKDHYQQALELYPELLRDGHSRLSVKDAKANLINNAKAGKLELEGRYIFLLPDMWAFCEWLFLGDKSPKGLLNDGEVYCKNFDDGQRLDLLRSPSLYLEHCPRTNTKDNVKDDWFKTDGIVTSTSDLISRVLQFDVDGDSAVVVSDPLFVSIAERNVKKYNIVPLYYEMGKGKSQQVDNGVFYENLKSAFGINIGEISNMVSKMWHEEEPNLELIAKTVAYNNFFIDYAKTLYKPKLPDKLDEQMKYYNNKVKLPRVFMYAKDKKKHQVQEANKYSTMDRLANIIPKGKIDFSFSDLGHFDYSVLMSGKNRRGNNREEIIAEYEKLNKRKFFAKGKADDKGRISNRHIYQEIRQSILAINNDVEYVVDVLIKHLYSTDKEIRKTTLWECFGEEIVNSMKRNLSNSKVCIDCHSRFSSTSNNKKRCDCCQEMRNKEGKRSNRLRKVENVKKSL